jgi:hypothetical protein
MMRPRLVQVRLGRLEIPALIAEKRHVPEHAGQCVPHFRLSGEVGGQLLLEGQGVAVGRLRVPQPTGGAEQEAQVVVTDGQFMAEVGAGGEVGGQLLLEGQGVVVGRLRCRQPARAAEQEAQIVLADGQFMAEVGAGGEVGG